MSKTKETIFTFGGVLTFAASVGLIIQFTGFGPIVLLIAFLLGLGLMVATNPGF